MIAREAGLEPLADKLFADPSLEPLAEAGAFVNADAGFADAHAVLDGVRDLLSERWAEDAVLVGKLREWLWAEGLLAKPADGRQGREQRRRRQVPRLFRLRRAHPHRASHRALAVFRGRTQEFLDAKLVLDEEVVGTTDAGRGPHRARIWGWRHAKRRATS